MYKRYIICSWGQSILGDTRYFYKLFKDVDCTNKNGFIDDICFKLVNNVRQI